MNAKKESPATAGMPKTEETPTMVHQEQKGCQQQLKTIDPATAGRQATAGTPGTEEHRKQQDRQQKQTHQEHNGQLQQQERLQQQKRQN